MQFGQFVNFRHKKKVKMLTKQKNMRPKHSKLGTVDDDKKYINSNVRRRFMIVLNLRIRVCVCSRNIHMYGFSKGR